MRKRVSFVVVCAVLLGLPVTAAAQLDEPLSPCPPEASSKAEPDWADELPRETPTPVDVRDVQVESRDGTLISVREYVPRAFSGRRPSVLVMSPYHSLLGLYVKEAEDAKLIERADCIAKFFNQRGYVVVLGDMRGTHNSDGCFDYGGPGDQADGYAVVQWMARQRWSNGRVGMYGVSHVGMSQYAAAVTTPPALKAIIPIAPITSFYRYLHNGGAHYETNMGTPVAYDYGAAGPPPTNASAANHLRNVAGSVCNGENTLRGMSLDGDFTHYWRQRDYSLMADRIKAAVFHVHGTLDQNVKMDHFTSMWRALERAGVPRKALIGPWVHDEPAVDHWHLQALRWFEHWLQRNDTGMMREPRVTTISQRRVQRTTSTFRSSRNIALYASSGSLSSSPTSGEASYKDVPGLPRQLLMGAEGARLLYDSAPMRERTRIVGVPVVELHATIDSHDTNFVAHLYDVSPAGGARYISRGYLDARHRRGLARGADVTSGRALRYRIELLAQDYELAKGHVLRLLIASSDSCIWLVEDPNTGRFCSSSGIVSDRTAAGVTVHEGPGRTLLTLPLGPLAGRRLS